MKLFIAINILLGFSSCVAINEGLTHEKVFDSLGKMEYTFYKKEKVKYGDLDKEYYLYFEPKEILEEDLIFYIHGGGWRNGSPEECLYIANYFNNSGYRVVLTGYPLIGDIDINRMNQAVLKSYLNVINKYPSENGKVILGGASAGGNLAVSLYFDNRNMPEINGKVEKIFSLSGVLDFTQSKNFVIRGMINDISNKNSNLENELNPINKLTEGLNLDFLLLYSRKDGIVEYENSINFSEKAKAVGAVVELIDVSPLRHDESYVYPFIYSDMYLSSFDLWLKK